MNFSLMRTASGKSSTTYPQFGCVFSGRIWLLMRKLPMPFALQYASAASRESAFARHREDRCESASLRDLRLIAAAVVVRNLIGSSKKMQQSPNRIIDQPFVDSSMHVAPYDDATVELCV